jgi:predicted GNAT family acetyltransferase
MKKEKTIVKNTLEQLQEYKFENYHIEENPEQFFRWCLDNNLYKKFRETNFTSRMRLFYKGEIEFNGLSAVVAFYNGKPVGIALCEHQDFFEPGKVFKDICKKNLTVKEEYQWGMQQVGMINLFVKTVHRGKGLAAQLAKKIELLRLSQLSAENFEWNPLSVPVFQAKELALDIMEKTSEYSYIVRCKPTDGVYPRIVHELTQGLLEQREGEPYPLFPLPKRKVFVQSDIKFREIFPFALTMPSQNVVTTLKNKMAK